MGRIKIFLLVGIMLCGLNASCAEPSLSTLVTPQNITVDSCNKGFDVSAEKLFYLTLASINGNRFRVDEMQTKTGYILFTAVNRQFLASISSVSADKSILKISPANNVYYFPSGIVQNIFRYITANAATPVAKLR